MEIEQYLLDELNITYDFTLDCDCRDYKAIQNPIDKYMAYRSSKKSIIGSCYKEASDLASINVRRFGTVGDPDMSSNFLQKIYSLLWTDITTKDFMKNDGWIQSDTMTSAQRTFNFSIESIVENEDELKYRRSIGNGRNKVSDAYCVALYARDPESFKNRIMNVPGEEDFLNLYHSLGNYIAVPVLFNSARSGNYASHDYWDLTMLKIHEYYLCEENSETIIDELLHNKGDNQRCKAWLDYFGNGETGWRAFVELYFLNDYVDDDYVVIPFCEGHSWNHPQIDNCSVFFLNVNKLIYLRGKRMFEACKIKKG